MVHLYNYEGIEEMLRMIWFSGSIQCIILTFLYKVLHPIIIRIFK